GFPRLGGDGGKLYPNPSLNSTHSHFLSTHRLLNRESEVPSLLHIRKVKMASSHNRKKTRIRVTFGKRVRLKRHELEMTQEELAEKCGLHPTYVGSVERGERNIALENIIALAKGLRCSPKDLLPESQE